MTKIKEVYNPEIEQDRKRWDISFSTWKKYVRQMERNFYQRRKMIRPMIKTMLQIDQQTLDRDFPIDKKK